MHGIQSIDRNDCVNILFLVVSNKRREKGREGEGERDRDVLGFTLLNNNTHIPYTFMLYVTVNVKVLQLKHSKQNVFAKKRIHI